MVRFKDLVHSPYSIKVRDSHAIVLFFCISNMEARFILQAPAICGCTFVNRSDCRYA